MKDKAEFLKLSLPKKESVPPNSGVHPPPEMGVLLVAILGMGAGGRGGGDRVNDSLLRQSLQSCSGKGVFL